MDFSYSDDQQAVLELAERILADRATHERQRALERAGGARFDRDLWNELARAGLVGIAIPEAYGGGGLGFVELAGILEQVGRRTAPVPLLETAVLGAMPVVAFGSDEQKSTWLPRAAAGEAVLTAALPAGAQPEATARAEGDGYRLSGELPQVPAGQLAARVLVPAAAPEGESIFLLDPGAPGVRVEPLRTTSGQPEARLVLEGALVAPGERLGAAGEGARIVAFARERATAALCAVAVGVCEEALRLTAEYAKTRKQFDQPIAAFQAVGQRAADAYIDTEAVRLTALQAAWRIDAGLPAALQVAVAKFWAAEGGQRVVHAAQHIHGGIGVDRDYPLHRYFLYAKHLELALGGATPQLLEIGRMLAEEA